MDLDVWIESARRVHGYKYDYKHVRFIKDKRNGKYRKVQLICPIHGKFGVRPVRHLAGVGCRKCQESHGERIIRVLLSRLGIPFIQEYKLEEYRFRYDFCIPDIKVLIEYHGEQHFKPVRKFGGKKAFVSGKERDETKVRLAANFGYLLLVFDYTQLDRLESVVETALKKSWLYWYCVEDKLLIFKDVLEVYKHFKIPSRTRIDKVDVWLNKNVKGIRRIL